MIVIPGFFFKLFQLNRFSRLFSDKSSQYHNYFLPQYNPVFFFIVAEEQAKMLATAVSVDKTNYSVSFNEFLKLMSVQKEAEPDHETLVDVFA